jgi:DNA invertase Pin-like site-specific DNA recombinase
MTIKCKAIGLIRVSTEMQAKSNDSISGQEASIMRYAKEQGIEIEKIYVEPGNSAFRGKRQILDHIDSDISKGIVTPELLIVYSYSRFTRKASNTASFRQMLAEKGISIVSVTEPVSDDEDSAFISESVIDLVSELQSRTNSKTVQDRLNDTARKGYHPGGVVPFGYSSVEANMPNSDVVKKILVINSEESEIVQEVFELAEKGTAGKPLGVKAIAKAMNDADKLYRGKRWDKNSINRILNDTAYYGKRVWGKSRITRKKDNPPIVIDVPEIITKELFDAVQIGLEARKPLKDNKVPINTLSKGKCAKTLLVGLLKCGNCGSNLRLMNGKKRPDKTRYQYYVCPKRTTDECPCPNIRRDILDEEIKEKILSNVLTAENIEAVVYEIKDKIKDITKNDQKDLLRLHKKYANTKSKLTNLYELISEGTIELDETLNELLESKNFTLTKLTQSINSIKKRAQLPLKKFGKNQITTFVKATKEVLTDTNKEGCKQLLMKVIEKVSVSETKITVYGTKFQLAELVSKTKMGTSNEVPTFVSMWR